MAKDVRTFKAMLFKAGPHRGSAFEIVKVNDDYREIADIIGADWIESTIITINDVNITVICDDEGLMRNNYASIYSSALRDATPIVGNVLLTACCEYGVEHFLDITDEIINLIVSRIRPCIMFDDREAHCIVADRFGF